MQVSIKRRETRIDPYGPVNFFTKVISRIGIAFAIVVGLPFIWAQKMIFSHLNFWEKRKVEDITSKQSGVYTSSNFSMEEALQPHLDDYIKKVSTGVEIDSSMRERMNSKLSADVSKVLKENKLNGHLAGMNHPIFRRMIEKSLIEQLDKVEVLDQSNPEVIRILLAYGYDPEDFKLALNWYLDLPSQ